ncbi:c-type cytochrome [Paracraurococcus lichenis]|uniref:C-type cytochrome n=1 Tax=Paracraurococcus lichenis TaxID=3064888 RepID=A0ABT9E4P5_9PROT|nr:c-type cytochrome [Paracraurococcus sp. LOR1-02]MDO9711137.1 c-type cytochrome [Paracraurococcus sp. LOR1-02]
MRHWLAALAALSCLLPASWPARAADIEAGRARAEQCVTCHGTEGITADPSIPSLAGQKERYLQWQLVFFRNGRRKSEIMNPLAADLSDEELRNLGAYFASLPRANPPPGTPDPALQAEGKQAAARHRCAGCHMDDYAGSQAAPAIAHQTRAYTEKALRDYRSAARPSVGVAAMNEVAGGLSDADITAIAVYLEKPE